MNATHRPFAPLLLAMAVAMAACTPAPVFAKSPHSHQRRAMTYTFDEIQWQTGAFSGDAVIGSAYGYHSASKALSVSGDGSQPTGGFGAINAPLVANTAYRITGWVKADAAAAGTPLVVAIAKVDGSGTNFLHTSAVWKGQIGSGWQPVTFSVFLSGSDDPSSLYLIAGLFNGAGLTAPPSFSLDPNASGRWVVDDLDISPATEEEARMEKLQAISNAMVARAQAITTGNGYAVTVGEVVDRDVTIPNIQAWPHVAILVFEEEEQPHKDALTRQLWKAHAEVSAYAKDDGVTSARWICNDVIAALEKALSFGQGPGSNWTGLNYVQMIKRIYGRRIRLTDEEARGVQCKKSIFEVTYSQDRGNPY